MIPSLSRQLEDKARQLVAEDARRTQPDAGGLIEALVAIHRPTKCWGWGAKLDTCMCCHETWPCQTLRLVCDAIGQEYPPQQMTACDGLVRVADGDGWNMCVRDRDHEGDCENEEGEHGPLLTHEDVFGR